MSSMSASSSRFALKPLHMIGIAIIVLSIVLGYYGLSASMRPYTTSVAEAKTTSRGVQLAGFLGSKGEYNDAGQFTFLLITVVSNEPKPSNFEQAVSIVAIGQYDEQTGEFMAENLLVKCPSKYQEQMKTEASS
jgi:cytochrome c-type biogenesis protein CcmE